MVATQRELVEQFVRNTIRNTRHDRGLTRTLFELLLPNELKEQAPDRRSLVIVLDDASARYPWELLENAYEVDAQPIAVSRGLLRQLETRVFREAPIRSLGNDVLVVGDPILPEDGPLKRLPGARDEASAVADRLERSRRFKVTRRIEASAKEIVQAFFARPYRMVHLAGHGVYEWQEPVQAADGATASSPAQRATQTVTGMVIGDGVYLTPGEVNQMRRVPELVFINCCHLGYSEDRERRAEEAGPQGAAPRLSPLADYHLFAANVATEFIRMGVRAVIAAGWAVDDAAGKTFAETFYGALLDGETFGKAVAAARFETYNRHSYANTWGAYQCYGDPDFRIVERGVGDNERNTEFASVEGDDQPDGEPRGGVRNAWRQTDQRSAHGARIAAEGIAGIRLERQRTRLGGARPSLEPGLSVRDRDRLLLPGDRLRGRRADGARSRAALQLRVAGGGRAVEGATSRRCPWMRSGSGSTSRSRACARWSSCRSG